MQPMQPAMPPPMYANSPVLVHTQPVMQPGQYPVPGQAPRGPMRSPYEPNGPPLPPPHMAPQMRQPGPMGQNGYGPGPIPANYARPPW